MTRFALAAMALFAVVCLYFGLRGLFHHNPPPLQAAPNHTLTLLAATPEGAKVYRVDGPKVVVPLVMVVGRDGGVAVR